VTSGASVTFLLENAPWGNALAGNRRWLDGATSGRRRRHVGFGTATQSTGPRAAAPPRNCICARCNSKSGSLGTVTRP